MTQAERRTLIAGGNLCTLDGVPRSWATNWPLHLIVAGTALLGLVISPGPLTALLVSFWLAAYAATHWAVVLRSLPGAGVVGTIVLGGIAVALLGVSNVGLHLFAAFMLMWVLHSTYRAGLAATLLLAGGVVLVRLPRGLESGSAGVAVALATGLGSALFSVLMATWIWQIETLSHERRELAEKLADSVRSLERTRSALLVLEHQRGVDEEAGRLAAEIHDTLAQSFTSITMLSQAARHTSGSDGPDGVGGTDSTPVPLLAQIEEISREGLAESRALIARTQAPLDLGAALDRLAADLEQRTGVRTTVDSSGWSSVATRTEVVLLRTLQEALRNIERHAGAGSVRIRLTREEGDALLEVSDDGAGFDVDLPTAGYGLVGTRSRLEAEGGVLHLVSSRGAGTTLWAVLPVTATTPEVPDAEPDAE
ncbi:sensor histidine kinase [Brachybacterium sp.]|uniref:sensor histidine kinase n=1 Tax=Brachybacterium sp. TaxID=1891286 RepID=UPI003F99A561